MGTISTQGSGQMLRSEVTYTVQVRISYLTEEESVAQAWKDVATVTVPAKTRTKTALLQGLREAGIDVTTDLQARCLDAGSAYVWSGRPKQDPALELS